MSNASAYAGVVAGSVRWTNCLQTSRPEQPPLIGLVRGEGVGPEVIAAALEVLSAIADKDTLTIEACEDVEVGKRAEEKNGRALPDTVINFCEGIFARGGAILHGPAGGRFVYDLRRQFDLFFKISPLQWTYQVQAFQPRSDGGRKLDILIARENSGGIYQGSWQDEDDTSGNRSPSDESRVLPAQQEPSLSVRTPSRKKFSDGRAARVAVAWP